MSQRMRKLAAPMMDLPKVDFESMRSRSKESNYPPIQRPIPDG